jgi:hypothetical protein
MTIAANVASESDGPSVPCPSDYLLDIFKKCWKGDVIKALEKPGTINSEYDLQGILFSAFKEAFRQEPGYLVLANVEISNDEKPNTIKPDLLICKSENDSPREYSVELVIELKACSSPEYEGDIIKFIEFDNKGSKKLNHFNFENTKVTIKFTETTKFLFASISIAAAAGMEHAFTNFEKNHPNEAIKISKTSLRERILIASWDYRYRERYISPSRFVCPDAHSPLSCSSDVN